MRSWIRNTLIVCLLLTAGIAVAQDSSGVTVSFTIEGFRNNDGQVLIALHNSEDTFPDKPEDAFGKAITSIEDCVATYTFENVPPGEYAMIYFHDEDSDEELDTNFIGIPKEGYGTSTKVKASGRPSWKDAVFSVGDEPVSQQLEVKYW